MPREAASLAVGGGGGAVDSSCGIRAKAGVSKTQDLNNVL